MDPVSTEPNAFLHFIKEASKFLSIPAAWALLTKLYRIHSTKKAMEKKYDLATDSEIRRELWNELAKMKVELETGHKERRALEERNTGLVLEVGKLKEMHRNCLNETAVLVGRMVQLEGLSEALQAELKKFQAKGF